MMFYRKLLEFDNMSVSDKIIYSFLIYKAISNIEGIYTIDGSLNYYALFDILNNNGSYWQAINDISIRKISQSTNISVGKCSQSVITLEKSGYIYNSNNLYNVFLSKEIISSYGFEIDISNIKPYNLMVFYFYLKSKSINYNGYIDTWDAKLAEEYHTTVNNIRIMLTRLKKKGLIERVENNKLKIN